jgi:hypothetical protein
MSDQRQHVGRHLQPPTVQPADLPVRIGPVEFSLFGATWVAVSCPAELAPLMRRAGAVWEPGSRRWLVHRRRLGPLRRALRAATDPLFRRAGIDLDGEGP